MRDGGTVLRTLSTERSGGPDTVLGARLLSGDLHIYLYTYGPSRAKSQELNATQVPTDGWLDAWMDGWMNI